MNSKKIAVIIPYYNEAVTIAKVVDDFHRELPAATVYVYDNNSSAAPPKLHTSMGRPLSSSPVRARATFAVKCSVISRLIVIS